MLGPIKTQPQLQEAVLSTYLYDVLIAIGCILLVMMIAHLISWEGGKTDRSGNKRRAVFFTFMGICLGTTILFNYFVYMRHIMVPAFKMDYLITLILGSLVAVLVYFLVMFFLIRFTKMAKLNSIFPKKN